jgi:uncharacterized DUF497 family protein
MVFEWDEMKSLANARRRGLPFEIAMALVRRTDIGEPGPKA